MGFTNNLGMSVNQLILNLEKLIWLAIRFSEISGLLISFTSYNQAIHIHRMPNNWPEPLNESFLLSCEL